MKPSTSKPSPIRIIAYILIGIGCYISYSNLPPFDGSVLNVVQVLVVCVGAGASLFFVWRDSSRDREKATQEARYLTFSYERSSAYVSSRESDFSSHFERFVKNYNISDPEFFAMRCIEAGMAAYEDAAELLPFDSVINNKTIKVRFEVPDKERNTGKRDIYYRY